MLKNASTTSTVVQPTIEQPSLAEEVPRPSSGAFSGLPRSRSLEHAMFVNIYRGEQLRGQIIAVLSVVGMALFIPLSYQYSDNFQAVFARPIPRVGILQILCATMLYGYISARIFGNRGRLSVKRFQFARYVNATIESALPSIMLIGVAQILDGPETLASPPVFLYFLFIILSALRFDLGLAIYTGLISAAGYILVAMYFVPGAWISGSGNVLTEPLTHFEKAGIMAVGGLITGIVTVQLRKLIFSTWHSHQEQGRIKTLFGQHVSDVVMEKLLGSSSNHDLREVVVLFFDIRNFTNFSENKEPAEVVDFLNTLFQELVEVVGENDGFVNKFLGDGFMAVFGAPLDDPYAAEHAVRASKELLVRLSSLIESGRIPATEVSMGLHAGTALTGTVGTDQRKEYTVIGDAVNTAARVESLNRTFNSTLLVTGSVFEAAPEACLGAVSLGNAQVKGREQPVAVYKLA
ncbi:MAG: adenylate/guanylate cyclase domain-containing protein [Deltaproteobacteria bacterium]|nr:adenylate/guanylate cyclase domain-containing protein [Deltaproteobacteria bacterium]